MKEHKQLCKELWSVLTAVWGAVPLGKEGGLVGAGCCPQEDIAGCGIATSFVI